MAIVYFFALKEDIDNKVDLLKKAKKDILIDGVIEPCIMGLLSPKDNPAKCFSEEYVCMEIDVDLEKCWVLNGDLSQIGNKEMFFKSRIPLIKYKFGTYRSPLIAVSGDISALNINISNKCIGNPIIFDTSDRLYKNNLFEEFRQRFNDFDETMLGIFFMLMAHKGKFNLIDKKRVDNKTVYIYQDNDTKKIYTIDVCEGLYNGQAKS